MSHSPEPSFIDTAAFCARFDERAAEHDRAREVFRGIRSGDRRYDPLFTSRSALSELATLLPRKVGHRSAVNALTTIREADSFNVLPGTDRRFDRPCEQFIAGGRVSDRFFSH